MVEITVVVVMVVVTGKPSGTIELATGCMTLPIIVGSMVLLLLLLAAVAVPDSMIVEDDTDPVSGVGDTNSLRHGLLLLLLIVVVVMTAVVVFVFASFSMGFMATLTGCAVLLAGSLMESSFVLPAYRSILTLKGTGSTLSSDRRGISS